jgi:hypothetical protein
LAWNFRANKTTSINSEISRNKGNNMASAEQYAKWCLQIIDGNDEVIDEIYEAMYNDGFVDEDQGWSGSDDEDDE